MAATSAGRRANGEGSKPRQRPDGRWIVEFRNVDELGNLRRSYVYGRTQKEVVAEAKKVRQRLEVGQPAKDAKITLSVFTRAWVESTLAASERKETTKQTLTTLANKHLVDTPFGATRLDLVKPQRIERWLVELREAGLSDATRAKLYNLLRSILATAVRDQLLARNPAEAVKRPTVERKEAAYLNEEEIQKLRKVVAGTRHGPLFEVMLMTGLRPGEARALKWDDVDLEGRLLHVDGTLARVNGRIIETGPKTLKSDRWLHMTDGLHAALTDRRRRQREERLQAGSEWRQTGYVFTTETGLPLDARNALRAIKAAAKAAGLPETIGLHSLRHSAASVMLTKGVPLTTVSEVLGHGSATITAAVYSHVAPEVAKVALEVLEGGVGS